MGARTEVGREDLHLHDLRHFGATLAAQAGATTKELMARLGHSSMAAAIRYQRATEDRDHAVAERMDALITGRDAVAGGTVAASDRRRLNDGRRCEFAAKCGLCGVGPQIDPSATLFRDGI